MPQVRPRMVESLSTARTADAAPLGLVQVGLALRGTSVPRAGLAHRSNPGQSWRTALPANGTAVECSTERPRAPERQPVAPVEGRAWETHEHRGCG